MNLRSPSPAKRNIILEFAAWTVLSALRSGAPMKSRKAVYSALGQIDFSPVLDESLGPIDSDIFEPWHAATLQQLTKIPALEGQIGWAAKMINVYLKCAVYVGRLGRDGLEALIHPPIDGGLWRGLEQRFGDSHPEVVKISHAITTISGVVTVAQYSAMMGAFRQLAEAHGCLLIELEQFWIKG